MKVKLHLYIFFPSTVRSHFICNHNMWEQYSFSVSAKFLAATFVAKV